MKQAKPIRLIGGNANPELAAAIAQFASKDQCTAVSLANVRCERFADKEIFIEIFDNVRGEDVFVIQPTSVPANDNLMELLIMIDALRRSSAHRITAVMPYFGYARQDRRTAARTPISAKLVANLLTTAGANRVLTLDLHAGQIQGFFDIPTDNLYAAPLFAVDIKHHFKQNIDNLMVVSPDVGGVVRARDLAKRIGAGLAIVDKRRTKPNEAEAMHVIGDVAGKCCIIVDDICDTAGTLKSAAQMLKDHDAKEVHAYISHGVLSGPALDRVADSVLKSLVVTDSIRITEKVAAHPKIRTISLAPLMGKAILNVAADTSVSELFEEEGVWPLYQELYPRG